MALFRRKRYEKYFKYAKGMTEAGQKKQMLSYAQWLNKGKPEAFTTTRTKHIESGLKQAGLTNEEIARFRRKK